MAKLTAQQFPLLAKVLLVGTQFDASKAKELLDSLVIQANEGRIELEDALRLAFSWGDTEQGGYFWGAMDDMLEDLYPNTFSYPFGFEDEEALDAAVKAGKIETFEIEGVEFSKVLKVLVVGFNDVEQGKDIYNRLMEHKDHPDLNLRDAVHLDAQFNWFVADDLLDLEMGLWVEPHERTEKLTPAQIDTAYRALTA